MWQSVALWDCSMVPPKQIDKVYFNTICCLGLSLSLSLSPAPCSIDRGIWIPGSRRCVFFHRLDCECSQVGTWNGWTATQWRVDWDAGMNSKSNQWLANMGPMDLISSRFYPSFLGAGPIYWPSRRLPCMASVSVWITWYDFMGFMKIRFFLGKENQRI